MRQKDKRKNDVSFTWRDYRWWIEAFAFLIVCLGATFGLAAACMLVVVLAFAGSPIPMQN